tara:strand:+ start:209 stop:571 length:363 start_codon:yes stop_codon:yes gene_type:complete
VSDVWVSGKAEIIKQALQKHQNGFITRFRKYGLDVNFFVFVAMIIFISDIDTLRDRTLFAGTIIAILIAYKVVHQSIVPNTFIRLDEKRPNIIQRYIDFIVKAIFTAIISLAVAAFWDKF